jgi:ABC-2 type transport system permease protein
MKLLGRAAFFPLVLGIFSALWHAMAESGKGLPECPRAMVWYLAVTEWILLSTPHPELDLEQLIRRGDIEYQLTLPSSLLATTVMQGIGTALVQAPIFLMAALASAWLFVGGSSEQLVQLARALPHAAFAMLVLLIFQTGIGLLAFWFQRVAPFCWVWQKAAFILGGLMLPLPFFPEAIQRLAAWTPFPALFYGPAQFMLARSSQPFVELAWRQFTWFLVALALVHTGYRQALSKLRRYGV